VGSRQSPGEELSDKPQSPFCRPAAALFAAAHSCTPRQSGCFSQIRPVTLSVTVPFSQSA
jgi:hypothetical protein